MSNIGRILVAIDDSCDGRVALDVAAQLAAEIRAELLGLFVEDESLFQLAELPFAQEVSLGSASRRALDAEALGRVLRARGDEVRKRFEALARAARLQASFQISRGSVIRATLAAAQTVDLVLIGRHGLAPPQFAGRISGHGPAAGARVAPIVVVVDGSPIGQRTLKAACLMASKRKAPVEIFLTGTDGPPSVESLEAARCACQGLPSPGIVHASALTGVEQLVRETRRRRAQLLLLSGDHWLTTEQSLQTLVANLDCPIGIVR